MVVTSKIRAACRELLEPGEEIHYVIPAEGIDGVTGATLRVYVVVSTHRISLFTTSVVAKMPQNLYATYPRQTRLGPVEYADGYFVEFEGMILEFADEFIPTVRAVDAEMDGELPDDPFPWL